MTVRYGANGNVAVSRRSISLSPGDCVLQVYVDGLPSIDTDLDQFPPNWIEAMEVYHGIDTPTEYGVNSCGVVLIWTR